MKTLLDEIYIFVPRDDKTNFCVEFSVPAGYAALRCDCSFSPKTVREKELVQEAIWGNIGKYVPQEDIAAIAAEDLTLVNHLTFSLDCGEQYLGCAHRHAATATHIIAPGGSSPGFIRRNVQAGNWRAVINIHSITSPEVRYSLRISLLTQEEVRDGI